MAEFRRNGSKILEVHLAGDSAKALAGSMVAFEGQISFKRASMGGEGVGKVLKRRMTGEKLDLMEMSGHGVVYLANAAADIEVIDLGTQTLSVESSSLLALSPGLRTDVAFSGLRGASSGQGLFTTTVSGSGQVAILSQGPPIALEVSGQYPLVVDPDAYICSLGRLAQTFVTDISWRSAIGEGSGEAYSLRFTGDGVVYIQPAER